MTPEQRMKMISIVTRHLDADSVYMCAELIEFIETLEFKAHCAGQDMERENHQEFYINCEPRTSEV